MTDWWNLAHIRKPSMSSIVVNALTLAEESVSPTTVDMSAIPCSSSLIQLSRSSSSSLGSMAFLEASPAPKQKEANE